MFFGTSIRMVLCCNIKPRTSSWQLRRIPRSRLDPILVHILKEGTIKKAEMAQHNSVFEIMRLDSCTM